MEPQPFRQPRGPHRRLELPRVEQVVPDRPTLIAGEHEPVAIRGPPSEMHFEQVTQKRRQPDHATRVRLGRTEHQLAAHIGERLDDLDRATLIEINPAHAQRFDLTRPRRPVYAAKSTNVR